MSQEISEKGPESVPPAIVLGYKATDKDIRCRGYQFVPGEWHEIEGPLVLCGNGFHFCEQPSGPWSYYSGSDTRIWRVEADRILDAEWEPGASRKRVAGRIRLVEEIIPDGHRNTGDGNTGDGNTGHRNTGHGNTGDGNTGHRNTGHGNTGHRNTGDGNTGDGNTGHRNTGHRNTGHGNTGHRNTGDGNTGDGNTGHRNTGDGNATDRCAGFFCALPQTMRSFDEDSGLTYDQFQTKHGDISYSLSRALLVDDPIPFSRYASLPGITEEKLRSLHQAFTDNRAKAVQK